MLRNSFFEIPSSRNSYSKCQAIRIFLTNWTQNINFSRARKYFLEGINYSITSIKSLSDHLVLKVCIILNESFAIINYWKDCLWKSRFHFGNLIVLNSHIELMNLVNFPFFYVFFSILTKLEDTELMISFLVSKSWCLDTQESSESVKIVKLSILANSWLRWSTVNTELLMLLWKSYFIQFPTFTLFHNEAWWKI